VAVPVSITSSSVIQSPGEPISHWVVAATLSEQWKFMRNLRMAIELLGALHAHCCDYLVDARLGLQAHSIKR
jgi:hypothetical protein